MYSLKKYRPLKTNDLVRIGRKCDGGYVINERVIGLTKYLIGIGISNDWSFEKNFKQKNKIIKIFAFDFSVSVKDFLSTSRKSLANILNTKTYTAAKTSAEKIKIFLYPFFYLKTALLFKMFFKPGKNNLFFKNGIDKIKDNSFLTVDEMFSKVTGNGLVTNSVFLKIDIEGSEYNILPDIIKYADYINGMVIEFHGLQKNWITFKNIMNEVMQQFKVVHIHGNNFTKYITNTQIPDCIEMTVTKKDLITSSELVAVNMQTYPLTGFDYPCKKNCSDIVVGFE